MTFKSVSVLAALAATAIAAGCSSNPEVQRLRNALSADQMPIPNEFPLLEGDHELWVSLTPAQQARAMLFLQDGSTILSSLQDDY